MESYITIEQYASFEYEDRKSVFIGECKPIATENEAFSFIESVKKRYPDARHHVYAYVLRENSIMRFSDDREPQGTAGMPVLDVIRKNGLTDTVIVVTRYFGGTLLGTGGLVRAYTAAAIGAVEAANIITYDVYSTLTIEATYSDYQKFAPIFNEMEFRTKNVRYTDMVILTGSIRKTRVDEFLDKLVQTTSGRVKTQIIDEKFEF